MEFLNNALPYAWELPRFEACEFSASFIASNKQKGGGDFRLAEHWDKFGDLDYRYEITLKDKKLYVKIFERDWLKQKALVIKVFFIRWGFFV